MCSLCVCIIVSLPVRETGICIQNHWTAQFPVICCLQLKIYTLLFWLQLVSLWFFLVLSFEKTIPAKPLFLQLNALLNFEILLQQIFFQRCLFNCTLSVCVFRFQLQYVSWKAVFLILAFSPLLQHFYQTLQFILYR